MNYSHLLVTGDFNFPKINWNSWTTSSNEEEVDFKFIEALRDGYFYQHVQQLTRIRGTDVPTLIDLILTNEEGMVNEVEIQSLLGKSDHALMTFNFYCYNTELIDTPSKFLFDKGNYDNMTRTKCVGLC